MDEKTYRSLDIDSYSSLSNFVKDRKKYAKKYVYKDKIDEEEKYYLTIGSLVDCLILTPEEFDDRFLIADFKVPTGQMFDFVHCLVNKSTVNINNWEEVIPITPEIMKECYDEIGFKRDTIEKVTARFDFEGREYYDYLFKSKGKTVISNDMYLLGRRIEEGLRKNQFTRDLINKQTSEKETVINQLAIVFKYNGYELKSLLDKVVIDHEKKTIYLYDLKTAYSVEEFEINYYKYNYYIQASLYWIALRKWAEEKGYIDKGYVVEHMEFIVCDSGNYMSSLRYYTTTEHYIQGISGFYLDGKYYKGLNQIISEVEWHRRNGIWNVSHDNFKEQGRINIRLGQDT